jgi:uncharacterized protein (DUF2252 family)
MDLVKESDKGRIPELVPIRHGRMLKSPFTFFRGAALNMADDLSTTPVSGLRVQACGDCHLLNFGVFATPERRLIFDVNDLDETLPAPWEWDVKRLTTSFVLACRSNGFSEAVARDTVLACAGSYREHMAEYGEMRALDVWYATIDAEKVASGFADEEVRNRVKKRLAKARARSVMEHDFPQLAATDGRAPTIRDNPPLIYHAREHHRKRAAEVIEKAFALYRKSLPEHRRVLLDRYKFMDVAIKVVGVGSVGTICSVMLLMAAEKDPLFLQIKQARPSVLERYVGKSVYPNDGHRIVVGYQLMQSASDIFLGWTEGHAGGQFYVRQLKDMKIKPMVEIWTPEVMSLYATLCGWALAHAHARSGEPAKISGYLGKGDTFDKAVAAFSAAYADQSERDHNSLLKAVRAGKVEVFTEEE